MTKKTKTDPLAMLNRPQDVHIEVPLKLAVMFIAWGLKSDIAKPFKKNVLAIQNEVAKQLEVGG